MRRDRPVDRVKLGHQFIVDVQPSGGIEDQCIDIGLAGLGQGPPADADRHARRLAVLRALVRLGIEENLRLAGALTIDLPGHDAQLLDRSRPLEVRRRDHDASAALLQISGKFRARGCLARALQAACHHDRGRRLHQQDVTVHRAHHVDEPLVNDADHFLARPQTLGDGSPDRVLHHLIAELVDDLQMHIRLKQRRAHLAHRLADVLLADSSAPREVAEGGVESLGKRLEHWNPLQAGPDESADGGRGRSGSQFTDPSGTAGMISAQQDRRTASLRI